MRPIDVASQGLEAPKYGVAFKRATPLASMVGELMLEPVALTRVQFARLDCAVWERAYVGSDIFQNVCAISSISVNRCV